LTVSPNPLPPADAETGGFVSPHAEPRRDHHA